MDTTAHPYEALTPDRILDAVETAGFAADGRLLALNSYENRVYQVGIADSDPVVAKFYRPGRWTDAAILEEHRFAAQLVEREVPAVPPLPDADGRTLHHFEGFRFALFTRRGGRWPELEDEEVLLRLGRFLGRLHLVGETETFEHRPAVDPEGYGHGSLAYLLESGMVDPAYAGQFEDLSRQLLTQVDAAWARSNGTARIRLHGDFHPGNILWREDGGAHIVDLDDCRSGPPVQDLWMLLSGERPQMNLQLSILLEGYEEFRDFDRRELRLIEPLRALRALNYAAWLARRWDDPAFPLAFPWFGSALYWEQRVLELRELLLRLEEPPLSP